jgi:hypothetical protein
MVEARTLPRRRGGVVDGSPGGLEVVGVDYEPAHLVSFTADVALIGSLVGGFTFERVGSGTRLSRWTELEAGGLRERLGATLAPVVRRSQGTELANLKRLIEAADVLPVTAGG